MHSKVRDDIAYSFPNQTSVMLKCGKYRVRISASFPNEFSWGCKFNDFMFTVLNLRHNLFKKFDGGSSVVSGAFLDPHSGGGTTSASGRGSCTATTMGPKSAICYSHLFKYEECCFVLHKWSTMKTHNSLQGTCHLGSDLKNMIRSVLFIFQDVFNSYLNFDCNKQLQCQMMKRSYHPGGHYSNALPLNQVAETHLRIGYP